MKKIHGTLHYVELYVQIYIIIGNLGIWVTMKIKISIENEQYLQVRGYLQIMSQNI